MALNFGEPQFSPLLHSTPFQIPATSPSHFQDTSTQNSANGRTILSNSGGAIAGATILGLVFLLGFPGNIFIVWSILARARKCSVTTLLILNLAFADGFLMLLTPFFMVYLAQRSWIFGQPLCKVLYYLCCTNMYASIFLITLMSLHRLVAIVWPKHVAALTNRRALTRVLVGLWVLALGLSAPVLVFRTVEIHKNTTNLICDCKYQQLRPTTTTTTTTPAVATTSPYEVMHYGMDTLLAFFLPYCVIIGSYVCILRRIRKTRFRRRIRSEKLILVIIATFGLFWLPYHTVNMVQIVADLLPESDAKSRLSQIRTSYRALTSTVAFVSSCINPILYTFAGKSYIRKEGLAFMARLFERTAVDTMRKTRQINQSSRDKENDEGESLKDKDSDSITTPHASSVKVFPQKNGK